MCAVSRGLLPLGPGAEEDAPREDSERGGGGGGGKGGSLPALREDALSLDEDSPHTRTRRTRIGAVPFAASGCIPPDAPPQPPSPPPPPTASLDPVHGCFRPPPSSPASSAGTCRRALPGCPILRRRRRRRARGSLLRGGAGGGAAGGGLRAGAAFLGVLLSHALSHEDTHKITKEDTHAHTPTPSRSAASLRQPLGFAPTRFASCGFVSSVSRSF
jgi:hypothetical protein